MFISNPTRILFFTGKGGVGKTSTACATAISLADSGKKVLLVSTDPASNLDEMLGVSLGAAPVRVPSAHNLSALNIDPEEAAHAYRERVVSPYRGILPDAAVKSMEEQLSGACTTEIAAFDEFSKLLGDKSLSDNYDHIIFDTAPTGHTLRLLSLPAAWTGFIETNVGGTSCLGPLSGLAAQKALYDASNAALRNGATTTLVLVARPDRASLAEAERTREELSKLGINNLMLIVNGVFKAAHGGDPVALAMEVRGTNAIKEIPAGLAAMPRVVVALVPYGLIGVDAIRKFAAREAGTIEQEEQPTPSFECETLERLIHDIEKPGKGVVMTMGKGGVGKTTVAARIAVELARRGHTVTLTTTDPASHVHAAVREELPALHVTRIDPAAETKRYREAVLAEAGRRLDAQALALLEEDLRSPCTEEIAVFRAFAETVAQGEDRFVVIDTAPTGHTLLLLDAAESYHREVLRKPSASPESVQKLSARLRDNEYTRILIITIPEATPIHEAMQLERDLARADIKPFSWIVNQSLSPLCLKDPVLRTRRAREAEHLGELGRHTGRIVLLPWNSEML